MNSTDIAPRTIVWQQLLTQAQVLAARLPGMGLEPDKLTLLPFNGLIVVPAFLKWLRTESKA